MAVKYNNKIVLEIVFLIIQIAFAVYISYLCLAFVTGAPFVPSTSPVAEKMVELAQLRRGQVVYDLGSGDGRILKLAAAKGAKATGFEINPFLVLYSKIRGAFAVWKNFWKQDLRDANVIFVYLLPWRMAQLGKKITRECKPGTLIVSNSFIFPDWKIVRQDKPLHIYVFRV